METRIETLTAENGATLELATIIHDGHEHTAGGAMIDLVGGIVGAYVGPRKAHPVHAPWIGEGALTDWSGTRIGRYRIVGTWTRSGGYERFGMTAIRATIDGDPRTWHGRFGSDWQSLVWLRPAKH